MVAALSVMMASSVFAQGAGPRGGQGGGQGQERGQGGPGQGGIRMMQNPEMAKKLQEIQKKVMKQIGLSAEQVKKVEALDKQRAEEGKKMFEQMQKDRQAGKEMDRDKMRETFEAMRKKHDDGMTKIMGKDKYAQYQKLMQAEMKKIRDEMEKKNGGKPGDNRQGGGQNKSKTGGGGR